MKTIKVTLTPTSPFSTPIQSDTLFGLFCWILSYQLGQDKLNNLLLDYDKDPFIVFSNGFKSGHLPKPILEPTEIAPESMESIKPLKKMKEVDFNILFELLKNPINGNLLNQHLIQLLEKSKEKTDNESKTEPKVESNIFLRNTISRVTNTVAETGSLYTKTETFYGIGYSLDVYVKYIDDKISTKEAESIFIEMGKHGYGKDRSTGKGHFTISIEEEFDKKQFFSPNENSTHFISLSNTFYKSNDAFELFYGKTFTKFPKMSGAISSAGQYLKNPIVLFESGSTFKLLKTKEVYGQARKDVFSDAYKDHFHSGYTIPLFFSHKETI